MTAGKVVVGPAVVVGAVVVVVVGAAVVVVVGAAVVVVGVSVVVAAVVVVDRPAVMLGAESASSADVLEHAAHTSAAASTITRGMGYDGISVKSVVRGQGGHRGGAARRFTAAERRGMR
jgi:hypothetical protein